MNWVGFGSGHDLIDNFGRFSEGGIFSESSRVNFVLVRKR
jgi:hypothetical protein